MSDYPRDLIGYGANPPHPEWPGDARVAVQFVLNYEEGGENCVLHGDSHSEIFLSEIIGAQAYPDRHLSMESIYEYGSRAGFWRLHRLFTQASIPVTVFGVTMALERHPEAVKAMLDADWEIASHALRWIHFQDMDINEERAQIEESVIRHKALTGKAPAGWYTGRTSPNTLALIAERDDLDAFRDLLPLLEVKAGRVLLNGYPTGVEVCDAMVHGGPYPATSDARGTSVGTLAIQRFLRPVCYQNVPAALLPAAVQDGNPLNLWRLKDGELGRA